MTPDFTESQVEAVARAVHAHLWERDLGENGGGHFRATRAYWESLTQAALTALKATPEWQAREQQMERVRELVIEMSKRADCKAVMEYYVRDILAALGDAT